MGHGMAMLLVGLADLILTKAPWFIDWLQSRREEGKKVTEADVAEVEALWNKSAEEYFGG